MQNLDLLTSTNIPRLEDGEVEAASPARQETLEHVVTIEPESHLVAGDARLGDLEDCGPDAQAVAHEERVLAQPFGGEVLAEHTPRKWHAGQLPPPVFVMLSGIRIDSLLFSAVHHEVSLAVASEIQLADHHGAIHWFFEDACRDCHTLPDDLPGRANIYGNEPHTCSLESKIHKGQG
jgi:hypothetical protein